MKCEKVSEPMGATCGGALEEVKSAAGKAIGLFCPRCREQWDTAAKCRWCTQPPLAGRVSCGRSHRSGGDR
jgi:hypothetical protein